MGYGQQEYGEMPYGGQYASIQVPSAPSASLSATSVTASTTWTVSVGVASETLSAASVSPSVSTVWNTSVSATAQTLSVSPTEPVVRADPIFYDFGPEAVGSFPSHPFRRVRDYGQHVSNTEAAFGDRSLRYDSHGATEGEFQVSTAAPVVNDQYTTLQAGWWETTNASGGGIRWLDSSGREVLAVGTGNPEGWVYGNGGHQNFSTNYGYQTWVRITVFLDWASGTFDAVFEPVNGDQRSWIRGTSFVNPDAADISTVEIGSDYRDSSWAVRGAPSDTYFDGISMAPAPSPRVTPGGVGVTHTTPQPSIDTTSTVTVSPGTPSASVSPASAGVSTTWTTTVPAPSVQAGVNAPQAGVSTTWEVGVAPSTETAQTTAQAPSVDTTWTVAVSATETAGALSAGTPGVEATWTASVSPGTPTASVSTTTPVVRADPIFEDFTGYPADGSLPHPFRAVEDVGQHIATTDSWFGDRSLRYDGSHPGGWESGVFIPSTAAPVTPDQYRTLQFSFNEPSNNTGTGFRWLDSEGREIVTAGTGNPDVWVHGSGGFSLFNDNWGYDTWVRVTLFLDWGTQTFDALFENLETGAEQWMTGLSFVDSAAVDISTVEIGAEYRQGTTTVDGEPRDIHIDGISMSPAPSPKVSPTAPVVGSQSVAPEASTTWTVGINPSPETAQVASHGLTVESTWTATVSPGTAGATLSTDSASVSTTWSAEISVPTSEVRANSESPDVSTTLSPIISANAETATVETENAEISTVWNRSISAPSTALQTSVSVPGVSTVWNARIQNETVSLVATATNSTVSTTWEVGVTTETAEVVSTAPSPTLSTIWNTSVSASGQTIGATATAPGVSSTWGVTATPGTPETSVTAGTSTVGTTWTVSLAPDVGSAGLNAPLPSLANVQTVDVRASTPAIGTDIQTPTLSTVEFATITPTAGSVAVNSTNATVESVRNVAMAPAGVGLTAESSGSSVSTTWTATVQPGSGTAQTTAGQAGVGTAVTATVGPQTPSLGSETISPTVGTTSTATVVPSVGGMTVQPESVRLLIGTAVAIPVPTSPESTLTAPVGSVGATQVVSVSSEPLTAALSASGVGVSGIQHISVAASSGTVQAFSAPATTLAVRNVNIDTIGPLVQPYTESPGVISVQHTAVAPSPESVTLTPGPTFVSPGARGIPRTITWGSPVSERLEWGEIVDEKLRWASPQRRDTEWDDGEDISD